MLLQSDISHMGLPATARGNLLTIIETHTDAVKTGQHIHCQTPVVICEAGTGPSITCGSGVRPD